MRIHEYQAKQLFDGAGIAVPREIVADNPDDAQSAASDLGGEVVVKAQVHTGGRGKAGGVKLADTADEARDHADSILGMDIKGHTVNRVLVAEQVQYDQELYLGFVFDRDRQTTCLMGCGQGGVDIETLAEEQPEAIHKEWAHPSLGFRPYQFRRVAYAIAPELQHGRSIATFAHKLFNLYEETDARVAEINPLVTHDDGSVTALDAKMDFDDSALFRQSEVAELRDPAEEDPMEAKAREADLHFVRLDGEVGIIGNGAGLVMTTLDVVDRAGAKPANFLDIGGSSSPEKVKTALEIVIANDNTQSIFINVFGGITRCDDVARGLIQAVEESGIELPIVVRLTGTNEQQGRELLEESGIDIESYQEMEEAAERAVELAKSTATV